MRRNDLERPITADVDPLAQIIDDHMEYLSGHRPGPPSLDALDDEERAEARELIELLEANWGSEVPGVPPPDDDPILRHLRTAGRPSRARSKQPDTVRLVPPRRLAYRERLAATLREQLHSGQHVVLTGSAGVGKSEFVLSYLSRFERDYHHDRIWCLPAGDPATLRHDYASLAGSRQLGLSGVSTEFGAVTAVREWLERNHDWLLVFDGAACSADLDRYLPMGGTGHVLITSRNDSGWSPAVTVEVGPWSSDEPLWFLRHIGLADELATERLAAAVGDLPTGLEQALAYMYDTQTPWQTFLERWERQADSVQVMRALDRLHAADRDTELVRRSDARDRLESERRMAAAWSVSLEYLWSNLRGAENLLAIGAFLGAGDIDAAVFREAADELPENLREIVEVDRSLHSALAVLSRYFLASDHVMTMDRLVQALVRESLGPEDERRWAAVAVRLMRRAFPAHGDDLDAWPACARLLPHATAAADHAESLGVELAAAGWLLDKIAVYQQEQANFHEARALFERALRLREIALGPRHPEIATTLDGLGLTLRHLGDLGAARVQFERSLAIRESTLGPCHPAVAPTLDGLGLTLRDSGDADGAKLRFERALEITEATFGPDHAHVATALNGLGLALRAMGQLEAAKQLFERALAIRMATYGNDHVHVATVRNNLGLVQQDLGNLAEAKALLEEALEVRKAAYGPDHPKLATVENNLGLLLYQLGDLFGAKRCLERALMIAEAAYNLDHPCVTAILDGLGVVLRDLGDWGEVKACFQQVLGFAQGAYGQEPLKVANIVENLGDALRDPRWEDKVATWTLMATDLPSWKRSELARLLCNLDPMLPDVHELADVAPIFGRVLLSVAQPGSYRRGMRRVHWPERPGLGGVDGTIRVEQLADQHRSDCFGPRAEIQQAILESGAAAVG
jgi:tetratricopeptide (TPR) repeat protein